MVLAPVLGPACGTAKVVKHGRAEGGHQRYKGRHPECNRRPGRRASLDRGSWPDGKQQLAAMAVNGSGRRDPARVRKLRPPTVMAAFNKSSSSVRDPSSPVSGDGTRSADRAAVPMAGGRSSRG